MTDKVYCAQHVTKNKKKNDSINFTKSDKKIHKINAKGKAIKDKKQGDNDEGYKSTPAETSLLDKITRKSLIDNNNDIEVLRNDPRLPLYSVKSFEALNIHRNLLKGVYQMGFNIFTKIQETVLPALLADPPHNLIVQAQSGTGTGKKAAFVLAMLSRVDTTKKYPQVLCLSRRYELAKQIGEVAAHMAKFCPEIKMKYGVAGEIVPRNTKLTEHILIGTPGKVLDWALKFKVFDLKKIRVFVLDGAGFMISIHGHQEQCIRIYKNLNASKCQMMFFSATYDKQVMDFAQHIVKNPIIIKLKREEERDIKQYYFRCKDQQSKYEVIKNIYSVISEGKAIVFCLTQKTAAWLSGKMSKDGHAVAVFSSDLTVEQRNIVLDRFVKGEEQVLITTNVLSRQIDLKQVTIIVNFDLPVDVNGKTDCETYLYRIERTRRFGKIGISINLRDAEKSMAICKAIEKHFDHKINVIDAEDSDEIEKQIGNSFGVYLNDKGDKSTPALASLLTKITTKCLEDNKNDIEMQRNDPHSPDDEIKKINSNGEANKDKEEGDNDEGDKSTPAEASLLAKIIRKGLVENKNDIEVQRNDPRSPLYSVKSFEAFNINTDLLNGVYEMGFNTPTKIQERALPVLLADPPNNVIAHAQSGAGKTAAFVLAMLSRVDATKKYPQVLCLSPTYELAIQTGEVAAHMAKFCPEIEIKYGVAGEIVPRNTKLTEHIIIGTPGKVLDWAVKFKVFDLKKIRVFVLDGADFMISIHAHQDQCIRIYKNLDASACQMMFFSATYDQQVMDFAEHIVKNPIIIRLKREEESLNNIKQYYVRCKDKQSKYEAITNIYSVISVGQAIVFCHTRKTAAWLYEKMFNDGHAVAVLSGDLTLEERINVLDRFREGKERVLISTNGLSIGIDVQQVTIVVNFDLPVDVNGKANCKTYLHRIGTTQRTAINLIDSEESMAICKAIEKHFDRKINLLDAEDSDEIEKEFENYF